MSRNIKKARITRISKVKADRSLEERVTVLEKQLTKVSCDIKVGFVNHAGIKVLPVHLNSAKNMNIDSDIIAVDKANEIIFFRDRS